MKIKLARGHIVLTATLLVTIGIGAFFIDRSTKQNTAARQIATEIVEKSDELRSRLLALYIERVKLASELLAASSAQPLKADWTQTSKWKAVTTQDLAALDSDQNQISNHLAQALTKIDIYGTKQTRSAILIREFEKFEQEISRKRTEYTSLAADFVQKNNGNYAHDRVPQFPAELALQRKANTK
jgi:hypothetical protein